MTFEQVCTTHRARPFEPFTLDLADGSHVVVSHPEVLLPARNRRAFALGGADDAFKIIQVERIMAIRMGRCA